MKKIAFLVFITLCLNIFFSCGSNEENDGNINNEETNSSFCEENERISVYLTSQEEVDAYGSKGCEKLYATLTIRESENNSITDLSKLSNLKTVSGLIIEGNKSLKNLKGLENITYVIGKLTIRGNNELEEINSLDNLGRIEEGLIISDNESLTDIPLNTVRLIFEGLEISKNKSLQKISGLNLLEGVYEHIYIEENVTLKDINGFNKLSFLGPKTYSVIDPDFRIRNNNILCNYCGFSNFANEYIKSNEKVDFDISNNKYSPTIGYISSTADCSKCI